MTLFEIYFIKQLSLMPMLIAQLIIKPVINIVVCTELDVNLYFKSNIRG